jgi:hypothetical protein
MASASFGMMPMMQMQPQKQQIVQQQQMMQQQAFMQSQMELQLKGLQDRLLSMLKKKDKKREKGPRKRGRLLF